MIVAIEGLIPGKRLASPGNQPTAPAIKPDICTAEWLREQEHQPADQETTGSVAAAEPQPGAPQAPEPDTPPEPAPTLANHEPFSNLYRGRPSPANPFVHPEKMNWVPTATGNIFDAVLDTPNSRRLSPQN